MKDWLLKRLTPRKKQEGRWTGLASGLQQVWEEYFDPSIIRLENLRSYFSAHEDDLGIKLREMGDYFAHAAPRSKDKPITVAWRRLELEYKDLELILTSVFKRHYCHLPVDWFPLFAPMDEEYGMRFIPADGPWPERKNIPPDGMFLTSRGLLGVDFGHLLSLGLRKQDFLDKALPLLHRTKPLHIVYDGPLWYIRFDIPFEISSFDFTGERDWLMLEVPFAAIGSRFDFTPADVRDLDTETMSCTWERDQGLHFFPFHKDIPWRTDLHISEGHPHDWLPLEFIVAGTEGEMVTPCRLFFADARHFMPFAAKAGSVDAGNRAPEDHLNIDFVPEGSAIVELNSMKTETTASMQVLSFDGLDWMDRYPRFDECPADKFPLDMPIGGRYV